MTSSKPPASPASPVSSQQLGQAFNASMGNIGQVSQNQIPQQVWGAYSPQLMSSTPYGYDPSQTVAAGNYISSLTPQMVGAGNRVYNTAFDPQQELFQTQQQQAQDYSRVANAQAGLSGTPYGASLESEAMQDFAMNWQNQQLQRQLAGIQGMGGAYGAGANLGTIGQGMASNVPINMSGYAGNLQNLGMGTTSPQQTSAGLYGSLFGTGAGAQNQNYANQLAAWQAKQNASNSMWGGIGKAAGTVLPMLF